jgi:hypothetical protein
MTKHNTQLAGQRARSVCAFVPRVHSICPTDLCRTLKPLTETEMIELALIDATGDMKLFPLTLL